MSTLLHPVGPQSPGVYWLRRIIAIAVVVALLVGIKLAFFNGGGGSTAAPGPTPSPTSTPSASATKSGSPEPTTTGSASPTKSASPTSGGTPLCKDSQITVTASTDAATYQVGATPRLRMRIQNTSDSSCRRDIGAAKNELVITSGNTQVWSSDDCNPGGDPQVVTLKPQQSYSVSVTWLGRLSAKNCPADQPLAQAGTYKLTGRNGEVVSEPAVFSLTSAG